MSAYEDSRRNIRRPGRRHVMAGVAALAAVGVLGAAAPVQAQAHGTESVGVRAQRAARAELPAPTGPYKIGTSSLRLTDHSRADPWKPAERREVMVSFWYPAGGSGQRTAPYMRPEAAAHFGSADGAASFNHSLPVGATDWAATRTHAVEGAPVARGGGGKRPVVLYSAGLGDPRTWNTALVEELASRGYVVVTVDHTHEASEVEFPGGRLVPSVFPDLLKQPDLDVGAVLRTSMKTRVADTRFVLDRLGGLRHEHGLPRGLAHSLDLRRVGMAGQSAGGFTAAQAMHDDRRIKAGINMDGQMDFPDAKGSNGQGSELSSVARDGLDRPFLLMGTDAEGSGDYRRQPSWNAFWKNTRGWHANLTMKGGQHGSYTDAAALLPQLARQGAVPADVVTKNIGTVRPERAVAAVRAYTVSFFDRWLRGTDDHLLDKDPKGSKDSKRFPEMVRAE
ncbi:alpha/beta hydrolase family protein [Streptomyces sp. NPDC057654]|uniref:alpha/beta hydrolase family protein n=1 Tax=Streptomyces sp. NPDC057654 TaxID=3346196 RepID=UPI0036910C93